MNKKQKINLVRIIFSSVIFIVLFFIPVEGYLKLFLYLVPYFVLGYDILKKAFLGIWNRQFLDENFLMAIATVGAFFCGEYAEGVFVMLFYQIGELFEGYAVGKSRKNIASLMNIRPDTANLLVDEKTVEVSPEEVLVGSRILVSPGERIPIDGIILEGSTSLDTKALTGESLPVNVKKGDEVFSGSVNISGVIVIETTKEYGDSTASKILKMIESASSKKSRSENFITVFARYYTPIVCGAALALAVLPPFVLTVSGLGADWAEWIQRALTFLVISCPCALVISVPLSFFGGIGKASSKGILIKGSNYMETLSKVKTVAFDKTGTLTKGEFEVSGIYPESVDKDELLKIVAHIEAYSPHPISKCIRNAYAQELDLSLVSEINEISGYGVEGKYLSSKVLVGNAKLMEKHNISYKKNGDNKSSVFIACDGAYIGEISVSDNIKPGAKEMISNFKKQGIKTFMFTGDRKESAEKIAFEAGVDEYKSELLPSDKVSELEKVLSVAGKNEKVAFVGDGINDAPVLMRADIGVAMGALGSDAAIEAADVVLMDDDVGKLKTAIDICKKTLAIVKQNIVFIIVIKILFLLFGAFGVANMWMSVFADVGVMVMAVLNSMRALSD